MSTPDNSDSKTFVEHNQSQQKREDYWDRNETVRETIRKCAKALSRGQRKHYHYVAVRLDDVLVPLLLENKQRTPEDYDSILAGTDGWRFTALLDFITNSDTCRRRLATDATGSERAQRSLYLQSRGYESEDVAVRACVEDAFQSCAAIAEHEEIIRRELRTRVDATIFGSKIGEHLQDAEQDLGESVEAISLLSGALKTIHTGGTGQGKSAGVEDEGEAYYLQNFKEGRDYKLIDPVGLRDGENWFYDIPLQDPRLRKSREDQGLPPSFAEDPDRDPETYPELEILVPLTPGLSQQKLPFDTDAAEFTVTPFTIPASAIRKRLLVSIMATKLTPEQESIVRSAYDEVEHRRDDWTLADLAEEVRSREELNENKKKPIVDTLRHLQNQGFIRTHEDEDTLDWDEIFADTETITVFSQAFIDDEIAQFIAVGHLAETIVKKREQMYGIAECLLLMREMWKVAPHNRRQSFDARAAALQEAIGHMLTELFRENRHSGVHLSCDTQYLSDLLKAIRELFNRYVVYNTNQDTVKDIFEWTANDKWKSFYNTLSPKPGEASVVGMVQPAIDERGIEYVGPIDYAGASHHHFKEGRDETGWHARADYLTPTEECPECESESLDRADDLVTLTCTECGEETVDLSMGRNEELRRPSEVGVDWDGEVPTRLRVDVGYDDEDDRPDVDYQPVAAFADRCLVFKEGAAVKREEVRVSFNEFMQDHDRDTRDFDEMSVLSTFGQRLGDAIDDWDEVGRGSKDRDATYTNLKLTGTGQQYLKDAMKGLEDAAAPLVDR